MKITNRHVYTSPDRPQWEKSDDGYLRCRARLLKEGVMPYAREELSGKIPPELDGVEPILMLVTTDTMGSAESIRSLEGVPITIGDHMWLTPELVQEHGGGSVAGTPAVDGPYLHADLLATSPEAIAAIETGECPEISAAYVAETVFEGGEFDGQPYHAKQTQLRYNHVAVIPEGLSRAGPDVRILNREQPKGEVQMVKFRLKNGKYVNVEEEASDAIAESEAASTTSLEEAMGQLETKTGEMDALQAEVDELKGELSIYKEKLDELLSSNMVEGKAAEMVEEQGEAEEVLENTAIFDGAGEVDDAKKVEVMNAAKGLYGTKLHQHVLSSVGVTTEGMAPEVLRGAFRAQVQIANSMKGRKSVTGTKMMNGKIPDAALGTQTVERSAHTRLGFPDK